MSRNFSIGLSLLDIVGCALGVSVVLAVIFSVIRIPPPPLAPNEFILVQATGSWKEQGQSKQPEDVALVGFFVRAPNGRTVVVPPLEVGVSEASVYLVDEVNLARSIDLVSAWSDDLQRQASYLSISQPSIGEWQVVPYYFDFPTWLAGSDADAHAVPLEDIEVAFWTAKQKGVRNQDSEVTPDPMNSPGLDGGLASRLVRIDISR